MDVAALSLRIDSSDLVKASAELDKFSAASNKASGAAGKLSNDGAKPAPALSRSGQAAAAAAASVDRYAAANTGAAASAAQAAQAAQRSAQGATQAGAAARSAASGWDMLTGKLNSNFAAINKNLQALNLVPASAARARAALNDNTLAMQATPGNIAAQFQDIGVTAAMGMSPLLIALQQGTQLSAAFAGGGLKQLGAALRSIISPASLLTIAIVAGVAALIQWAMSADRSTTAADRAANGLKTYTEEMGYTREEVEKLNAVTVTFGDTMSAVFEVGLQRIAEAFGTSTAEIGAGWRRMLADMLGNARQNIAEIYGVVVAGGKLLDRGTSGQMGDSFGDMFDQIGEDYRNATQDALKFFEDVGAQARANALARQNTMAASLYNKPSEPRGGKTDAEKFADIVRRAQEDITAEQNRAKAVEMSALAVAELEQKTKLLNAAASAGLKITPQLTAEVDKLAAAYANAKVSADTQEAIKGVTDEIDKQRQVVEDQVKLIGLYGDALARARREQEAQKALRDATPRGEIVVMPNLTGGLSDDIDAASRLQRLEDIRKAGADAAYAMDLERGAMRLTGEALVAYNYATDQKLKYQREGIDLSPEEVAAIEAAGEAYARQRYAIDQAAKAIADAREVTRGFFADWINAVREGGNIFKAFADSVVNSLNRIIDKLLDRTLDSFLNNIFARPEGGGFLEDIFSASVTPNALGGVYSNKALGAYSNTVVNTPTLFRFAKGAAIGEMGEAGPEAIMPLKRGPNGALGVQMHGGAPRATIEVKQDFHMAGVMTPDDVAAMVRQGSASAVLEVKRNLDAYLREWDIDGAVAA